jgi:hypothetical protein
MPPCIWTFVSSLLQTELFSTLLMGGSELSQTGALALDQFHSQ